MYSKKYLLDSVISLIFWVPLAVTSSHFIIGLEGFDLALVAMSSATLNILCGGLFGWVLDKWREILKKKL